MALSKIEITIIAVNIWRKCVFFYDLERLETQLNMDQLVSVGPSVTPMVEVGGSGLGSVSL